MEAGVIQFGDGDGAARILEEARRGDTLGRVIGNGAVVTGRVFGIANVPTAKGQAMAAYDPRAIKGMGVTYATSAMGADHTAAPPPGLRWTIATPRRQAPCR
jgi:aldehyde:ferredoxin oxidoreductase